LKTFGLEEIFKIISSPLYGKFDRISGELQKIKEYNITNRKISFLHPAVADIYSPRPFADIRCLNSEQFDRTHFKRCKFPWSSLHINYDGEVFPCLSVGLGNLKNKSLKGILRDKSYQNFLGVIKRHGLVPACNRCGWLRLA
jgi:MoaA/NifB/PqqE/SkfB family radical SAM enzyme